MHRRKLFRHFHKIHHLSIVPTPWATLSVNVNELLLTAPFMPLLVMVMPMHISVWGAFAILSVVKNVANHAGYEVVPNRLARGPLRWWVTTTHHDLHHRNPNYNFGAYFTWWDRWMGTENPAYYAHFAAAVRKPLAEPEAAVQTA